MRAPALSRRALAATVLPALASAAPATATPAGDAALLALARAIHAADAELEAACRRVSRAHGTPEADALEEFVERASEHLDALIRQAADTPAEGELGVAVKATFAALAISTGASLAEQELGDSLRRDVARLYPVLAEVTSWA